MKMRKILSYSELKHIDDFFERFEYLKLGGIVGESTFGFDRYLNQTFYKSHEWLNIRNHIIFRDNANDLGVEGYDIAGRILIHHINPITEDDIINRTDLLLDPDNLICVSHDTHNAIHFGDASLLPSTFEERYPGDTKLW